MLEKYLGRKKSPKVTIKAEQSPVSGRRPLIELASSDSEFMHWFSGSVVSDSMGNPLPVFHGSLSSNTFESVYKAGVDELGVHFGSSATANDRLKDKFDSAIKQIEPDKSSYEWLRKHAESSQFLTDEQINAELLKIQKWQTEREEAHQERLDYRVLGGEKIFPVFLKITNPVRIVDPGSFTENNLKRIKKDLIRNFVTRDQVDKIRLVKTINELKEALISLGYDGVVYENMVEGQGTDSYIPIVGAEQIRSVFDTNGMAPN